MFITVATTSILAITGLVWLFNIVLPFKICPICAGVSGTWLWMLAVKFLGYEIDMIVPAMLMGGSVVGIAYQIEKRLPPGRSPILWKTLFIPAGFVTVYGAVSSWWAVFVVSAALLIILALRFTKGLRRPKGSKTAHSEQNQKVEELEKKMKDCC